jgi:hypothetical protein
VPIQTQTLPNGVTRYAIPITVGGQPVLAGLDTGSFGLRLLPGAQFGLAESGTQPVDAAFGSGVVLTGPIVRGQVAIGARAGSIDVQKVTRLSCTDKPPTCYAKAYTNGRPIDDFRVLGDGYTGSNGFLAIIGIRPNPDARPVNPLIQLGFHRWIVSLPQTPGATGTLVLNPSDSEVAGFTPVPSGQLPGRVLGCLSVAAVTAGPVCGQTDIDTGAPGIVVYDRDFPASLPADTPAQFVFGASGATSPGISLLLNDRAQVSRYAMVSPLGAAPTEIRMGVTPYLAYDILYDADRGTMAVRARSAFTGGPLARP